MRKKTTRPRIAIPPNRFHSDRVRVSTREARRAAVKEGQTSRSASWKE